MDTGQASGLAGQKKRLVAAPPCLQAGPADGAGIPGGGWRRCLGCPADRPACSCGLRHGAARRSRGALARRRGDCRAAALCHPSSSAANVGGAGGGGRGLWGPTAACLPGTPRVLRRQPGRGADACASAGRVLRACAVSSAAKQTAYFPRALHAARHARGRARGAAAGGAWGRVVRAAVSASTVRRTRQLLAPPAAGALARTGQRGARAARCAVDEPQV